MSDDDRRRWDQRYAEGAYQSRPHPSALLAEWAPAGPGVALDVAAGGGRNSVWLADGGFDVTAIDISAVGLARLDGVAGVRTVAHDLDNGLPDGLGRFDLIVVMRYLNLGLMPALMAHLRPGGMLILEVLFAGPGVGPEGSRFRAQPGALAGACDGLALRHSFEGQITDPDGRAASVAQVVAVL